MYQNGYQGWDILRLNEYVGPWGRYSLKQGNPLYFFIEDNNLEIKEQSGGPWGSYGLKKENPLQFFKTLIESYLFYVLICLLTVS